MRYIIVLNEMVTDEMLNECDLRIETAIKTPDGLNTPMVFSKQYFPEVGKEVTKDEYEALRLLD